MIGGSSISASMVARRRSAICSARFMREASVFDAGDPLTDLAAGVFGGRVVPRAEAGLIVEEDSEFVGKLSGAGFEIGLKAEGGGVPK